MNSLSRLPGFFLVFGPPFPDFQPPPPPSFSPFPFGAPHPSRGRIQKARELINVPSFGLRGFSPSSGHSSEVPWFLFLSAVGVRITFARIRRFDRDALYHFSPLFLVSLPTSHTFPQPQGVSAAAEKGAETPWSLQILFPLYSLFFFPYLPGSFLDADVFISLHTPPGANLSAFI